MDKEFLALSLVFILMGVTGIILFGSLFYNGSIFPVPECSGQVCANPSQADSCFCLISSPEPGAAQGTSSIILALGVMFFPMGLMKGGLPSFRRMPPSVGPVTLPSGRVVTPLQIGSGLYFTFGLVVILIGVDAVLIPGYLLFRNPYFVLSGALLAAAGGISTIWGLRKSKS
jgi:hypothetical protein